MIHKDNLPANIDCERLVLGAALTNQSALHGLRMTVTAEDFSREDHRRIWRAICAVSESGTHVDRITVCAQLEKNGVREAVGGLGYLVRLDDEMPQYSDVDAYVVLLKADTARRKIIFQSDEIITRAMNGDSPQAMLQALARMNMDIEAPGAHRGLVSARQLVDQIGADEILAPRIKRGLPFPWEWMTSATCGMLPSEMWVLAGHTSSGKTSAALQAAVHLAQKGKGVAMFSLEMGSISLFQRAVGQISRIDSELVKRDLLKRGDRQRLIEAANEIRELPLFFDERSSTIMEIQTHLRRQSLKTPVELVVVDYLQLIRDVGRHGTRAEAVGAAARALKLMATEFNCAVLLLSQFSRESNKPGKFRRPELSDLKESGDIENHCNGAWFIHREDSIDQEMVPCQFLLAKQRDGKRNVWGDFVFLPRYQVFDATEKV